jgi:hypothetical protein
LVSRKLPGCKPLAGRPESTQSYIGSAAIQNAGQRDSTHSFLCAQLQLLSYQWFFLLNAGSKLMSEDLYTHVDTVVREALRFFPECLLTTIRQSSAGSVIVQVGGRSGCRTNRLVLLRSFLEGRFEKAGLSIADCSILRDCMTIQVKVSNNTPMHESARSH